MDYPFQLSGMFKGGRQGLGELKTKGYQHTISIGNEMNGPGEGTNPDELLIGAVSSCYLITLSIGLEKKKITYNQLNINTTGIVTEEGGLHFKEIVQRPVVEVNQKFESPELRKTIIEAMYQAEKDCMIAKALKGNVEIRVEPDVRFLS